MRTKRKVLSKKYGKGRKVGPLVQDADGAWHEAVSSAHLTAARFTALHELALMANLVRDCYVRGLGDSRVFKLNGELLMQPEFAARIFKGHIVGRPSTLYKRLDDLLILTVGRRKHDGEGGPVARVRRDEGTGIGSMPNAIAALELEYELTT